MYYFSQHFWYAKISKKETHVMQFETAIRNDYNTFGKRLEKYLHFYEISRERIPKRQTFQTILNILDDRRHNFYVKERDVKERDKYVFIPDNKKDKKSPVVKMTLFLRHLESMFDDR